MYVIQCDNFQISLQSCNSLQVSLQIWLLTKLLDCAAVNNILPQLSTPFSFTLAPHFPPPLFIFYQNTNATENSPLSTYTLHLSTYLSTKHAHTTKHLTVRNEVFSGEAAKASTSQKRCEGETRSSICGSIRWASSGYSGLSRFLDSNIVEFLLVYSFV